MGVGESSAPRCGIAVRFLRLTSLSLAVFLGASSVSGQDTTVAADTILNAPPIPQPSFKDEFEPFSDVSSDLNIPDEAVDLEQFEVPLEQQETQQNLGTGVASYYGRRFHGRLTANGERFDMNAMTAAHKTLPFGTRVRVTNPSNGKSVVVRINDRGPFIRGRTIDLSRAAATQIGMIARGHATVELAILE